MDSDSSSESDDEFLTVRDNGQGSSVDREALIRKKLLESFYGQTNTGTATAAAAAASASPSAGDDGSNASASRRQSTSVDSGRQSSKPRNSADLNDLDSPYFDVASHTSYHVVKSSVHKLLEMDEQLTLQVRTLDSSTQNMVYENYSKFIDATEAVKSVGVNVQANQGGLERLQQGMAKVNDTARLVEGELGGLRDAVAEKIRVKRLLTRLDALLKLPQTLQDHINQGHYRTAGRTFCRSTNILSKHSAGFESLQNIEQECHALMQSLIGTMRHKIMHWSGQEHSLMVGTSNSYDSDEPASNENTNTAAAEEGEDGFVPPDPPQSISEIFECTGTLALLVQEQPANLIVDTTLEKCQSMSLAASVRYLDRLFDTHQLELQESAFSLALTTNDSSIVENNADMEGSQTQTQAQSQGHHLVPTLVIDSILEVATLYSMSFHEGNNSEAAAEEQQDKDGPIPLVEFVTEVYGSFLDHVRTVLLEHSVSAQVAMDTATEGSEQEGDGDEVYEDVAGAMSLLLHTVRELATGLSMPEVGLSGDFCADLVEQASVLTETLVRRRVEQKFCDLRLRVVNDCLVPFATRVIAPEEEKDAPGERARVLQLVQIAVSDCLQLLDDTVRSIVSGRNILGASAASVDLVMLKECIQASMIRFASWLGGTLEVMAGCETSDPNFSIEAVRENAAEDSPSDGLENINTVLKTTDRDDVSELSNQYDPLAEKVESATQDLIAEIEGKNNGIISLDFALKVCEMCRSCERAFVDSMNQSIESNVGGGKNKRSGGGLFPMDDSKKDKVLSEHERKTTERFSLAASRILTLYAMDRGFEACKELCENMATIASKATEDFSDRPCPEACRLLEIVKSASFELGTLFREDKCAGPVPTFSSNMGSQSIISMNSSPVKGLQADVERMFKEQVSIYPHSSETIDFSRNAVLFLLFKVAFKAVAEQTRNTSFSVGGYNQLLLDLEFLRDMVSHYVDENYQSEGSYACSSLSTLLSEVLSGAGENCLDEDYIGNDDLVRSARSVLRGFMASSDTSAFVISEA